jgi:hypothetical protein
VIPVDLNALLSTGLEDSHTPSGKLYVSEVNAPLRHVMLRVAGAPQKKPSIASQVAMQTGTFWHDYMNRLLIKARVPVMQEVNLAPWLPDGWSGTADWLFWSPEYEAFVLADLKTAKAESWRWLKDEPKENHLWQLSAYWYALEEMGLPLVKGFALFYLPKEDKMGEQIEPIIHECGLIDKDLIHDEMESRWAAVQEYLYHGELPATLPRPPEMYLNDYLAPVQERVQKLWWDKKAGVWNVKLVPHWSAAFCPYDSSLCDCSEQGTTKIGEWYFDDNGEIDYRPRKGYEDYAFEPEVEPAPNEIARRRREVG